VLEETQHLPHADLEKLFEPRAGALIQVFLELRNPLYAVAGDLEKDRIAVLYFSPLEERVDVVYQLAAVKYVHLQGRIRGSVAFNDLLPRFDIAVVEELV